MNEKFYQHDQQKSFNSQELEDGLLDYEAIKNEIGLESESESSVNYLTTDEYMEKNGPDAITELYQQYEKAIKRRNREPLEKDSFVYHFFRNGSTDQTFMYGKEDWGYFLGVENYGVFVPTHFAPKTIRCGYKLTVKLGDDIDRPAVMAITQDLEDTLLRLPNWHAYDLSFMTKFRGANVRKKIVYNESPQVSQLMTGLMDEYMQESYQDSADSNDNE